jgi:hypothetical protein
MGWQFDLATHAMLETEKQSWRHWWAERAAIIEYEGRIPRETAERMAFDIMVNEIKRRANSKKANVTDGE